MRCSADAAAGRCRRKRASGQAGKLMTTCWKGERGVVDLVVWTWWCGRGGVDEEGGCVAFAQFGDRPHRWL